MAIERPELRLLIHYHRPERDNTGWSLWVWNGATHDRGREVVSAGQDDFGLLFEVDPSAFVETDGRLDPIGFLPRRNHWEARDGSDRIWHPDDPAEIWVMARRSGWDHERPDTTPFVVGGFIDQPDELLVELYHPVDPDAMLAMNFLVDSPRGPLPVTSAVPAPGDSWIGNRAFRVRLGLDPGIDLDSGPVAPLTVLARGVRPGLVWPRHLLDRPEFRSERRLGAVPGTGVTICRVFAPTAATVDFCLYREPRGGVATRFAMTREAGGTWLVELPGDRSGAWYTLRVDGPDPRFHPDREFIDPYARAVSAHDGRARITRPTPPPLPGPSFGVDEAVVYELHLRDVTMAPDSGVNARGLYLGLSESGTHLPHNPTVTTALDHILELGANTVQLLPIQDFENDELAGEYHWGYMPVNFNVPDGAYATGQDGDERIDELKRMIDALHRRGLKVVMDVVFNHTAEMPPDKIFSFEGLAPGYYYRLHADGSSWNGSGTGNEFRTEAPMARRFILDALRLWVTEYGIDGFRFDLMGLIDLDTMKMIVRELRSIRPDIFLWGEPWTAGPTPIAPTVKGSQRGQGFAVFNDHFRNAIKGDAGSGRDAFLVSGGHGGAFRRGLEGSLHDFADSPLESVNYVECHDNQTLWDRLKVIAAEVSGDEVALVRLHRMAGAAVLLARGIPFLSAGQDFLRTKQGVDNSYNLGDAVNRIEWSRKAHHLEVFRWHRDLIRLRRAHPLLRQTGGTGAPRTLFWLDDDLHLPVPVPVVAARIDRGNTSDAWNAAIILFNPAGEQRRVPLPDGNWVTIVDGITVDDAPLPVRRFTRGEISAPGRSVLVLARE
ncbi:MAG: alpha-amylase family glycosyl hydrolase [Candidatus Eisenbacteria bacterium]|nr:alpha-amylase family glycosyl hydrolase [Candidatus Eisenbacteria bacterium]